MRVRTRVVLAIAAAVGCVSGCAGNRVPREWRPPAEVAQRNIRGGWITIEAAAGAGMKSTGRPLAEGELIAIDGAAFHVLTTAGLQAVPRTIGHRITVVGYGTPGGGLALWAVAGGLSTLSHGWFLEFTAPMWAIAGIAATLTESRAGRLHDNDLAGHFARFPQGLPPGFDPKSLGALPAMAQRPRGR